MAKDKRRARRRPMRYAAWVALAGGKPRDCLVSDISETGARLDVHNSSDIPEHFILMLSRNGAARRYCSVVWRNSNEVGVQFARSLAAAEKASLVPKVDADAEAAQSDVPANVEPAAAESLKRSR